MASKRLKRRRAFFRKTLRARPVPAADPAKPVKGWKVIAAVKVEEGPCRQ